jgi:hypothetical protein
VTQYPPTSGEIQKEEYFPIRRRARRLKTHDAIEKLQVKKQAVQNQGERSVARRHTDSRETRLPLLSTAADPERTCDLWSAELFLKAQIL